MMCNTAVVRTKKRTAWTAFKAGCLLAVIASARIIHAFSIYGQRFDAPEKAPSGQIVLVLASDLTCFATSAIIHIVDKPDPHISAPFTFSLRLRNFA
jgi:hypothetical protein